MNVIILGFVNTDEVSTAMEKLIKESQCYLFTVVGVRLSEKDEPIGYQWAKKNGAPYQYLKVGNEKEMLKEGDYLVVDLREAPGKDVQRLKNFVMQWKAAGKHGTCITE